jgi:hypothetical protein
MRHTFPSISAVALGWLAASPFAGGAEPSIGTDLRATIALQGLPCDQIAQVQRNGDSDYTATCKDGNRYHVYIDPQGRVVVKKL